MSFVAFENNINQVTLLSPVSVTGTTNFVDVTGLSLPMMANTIYKFEFEIMYQVNATNRGPGFGVNGPASPNYVLVHTEIPTSLTTVTQNMVRAYDTGTAITNSDAANLNCYARCYGFVSNGANAGNLILRFRENNSGGTIVIQPGTIMRMWRINPKN